MGIYIPLAPQLLSQWLTAFASQYLSICRGPGVWSPASSGCAELKEKKTLKIEKTCKFKFLKIAKMDKEDKNLPAKPTW